MVSFYLKMAKKRKSIQQQHRENDTCHIQGFLSTHHASTKRAVPVSNERVGYHEWDCVGVRPSDSLYGDGDVSERHFVVTHSDLKR